MSTIANGDEVRARGAHERPLAAESFVRTGWSRAKVARTSGEHSPVVQPRSLSWSPRHDATVVEWVRMVLPTSHWLVAVAIRARTRRGVRLTTARRPHRRHVRGAGGLAVARDDAPADRIEPRRGPRPLCRFLGRRPDPRRPSPRLRTVLGPARFDSARTRAAPGRVDASRRSGPSEPHGRSILCASQSRPRTSRSAVRITGPATE